MPGLTRAVRRAAAGAVPAGVPRFRQVDVTAVDTSAATATVSFDGGTTTLAGVPYLTSYLPAAGDVATLALIPGSRGAATALLVGRTGGYDADLVELKPAGNADTGSSTSVFATWITVGNITVPAWATRARYQVVISGVYAVTASPTGLTLRLTVGGVAATNDTTTTAIDITNQPRGDHGWQGRITGLSTGSQSVVVQSKKGVGSGAMRADTSSQISVSFGWEP